ncbi:MAG: hypothetical protein QOD10_5875 [Mycobacterium sp.]|jgi:hypothetical protein|nr:hypothetical protein [Mycobacterium sp.]MDT5349576.1 hypothetical protein [Mycobacterium sp.]
MMPTSTAMQTPASQGGVPRWLKVILQVAGLFILAIVVRIGVPAAALLAKQAGVPVPLVAIATVLVGGGLLWWFFRLRGRL